MANPFVLAFVVGVGLTLTLYYLLSERKEQRQEYSTDSGCRDHFYSSSVCSICQEQLSRSSRLLKCGHSFHGTCIEKWFQIERTCPNCRKSV